METLNNNADQVFCHKQGKDVSRDSCRRCESYNAADIYDLFNRCRLEEERFTALFKVYQQHKKALKAS